MASFDSCRANDNGPAITGITLDSRQVRPGDLYVGLHGLHAHGASFAASAVESGAVAVLTDEDGATLAAEAGVPIIVVDDPRVAMAVAAAKIFGHPSDAMTMFGITGTNGKTTTAFLVEAGLRAAGHHVGTIGTIGFRLDGEELPSARTTVTTPEAPDLQGLFAAMAERGASDVVMEVSSHALALQRVDGTCFDVVAFTNLGRDHLDFHNTLDNYFNAKARLFTPDLARVGVINVDDPRGRQLVERMQANGVKAVTTSIHQPLTIR
ncbi:UDP-N-acetylmuramoylalanyl-D-glutamate-2,6-diaminopimelate ligase [Cutibacterium acnes JCM 18909]|nr:UDP-N-acetylmuramoylalanyl-D-glutamate-2,6-diaminopimelate ligase [Cutibacterium acnes JCM 18909]